MQRSSEKWSVVKVRCSPTMSCTMLPAYVEQGAVDSLLWWIHLVCPQCFSLTVPPVAILQVQPQQSCSREPSHLLIGTSATVSKCFQCWSPWSQWNLVLVWVETLWQPSDLPEAPNMEEVLLNSECDSAAGSEALIQYADKIICIRRSNVDEAPPPKTIIRLVVHTQYFHRKSIMATKQGTIFLPFSSCFLQAVDLSYFTSTTPTKDQQVEQVLYCLSFTFDYLETSMSSEVAISLHALAWHGVCVLGGVEGYFRCAIEGFHWKTGASILTI